MGEKLAYYYLYHKEESFYLDLCLQLFNRTFLIFNTNTIFIHLSLSSIYDIMIHHNLFFPFTQHMINKKESFELTHIEYYQINNISLLSYM